MSPAPSGNERPSGIARASGSPRIHVLALHSAAATHLGYPRCFPRPPSVFFPGAAAVLLGFPHCNLWGVIIGFGGLQGGVSKGCTCLCVSEIATRINVYGHVRCGLS
eukprot:scaffold64190_cov32-Tisochrysis_lutea.AAC.2